MGGNSALTTDRIMLRPCVFSDIPGLLEGLNDWEIAQWLPGPPFPYTESDGREFVAASTRTMPPDAYAVVDPATSEFLGVLGLARTGETAELGYWLLRQHQGKGIMREAVTCLLESIGNSTSSIFATVDRGNIPSIKLLELCGLHLAGPHIRETPNRQGNTVVLRYEASMPIVSTRLITSTSAVS